ncbi:hypothetical protein [Rothia sp. CCM 9419]|uniref:hypothetical protein n=1 Tax=Rothia sp. CCM 9419 TaxID=3402662 RepID=UPI003AEC2C3D
MSTHRSSRNHPTGQVPYSEREDATRVIPSYNEKYPNTYEDAPTEVFSYDDAPTRPFSTHNPQGISYSSSDAPTQVMSGGPENYHQQGYENYVEKAPTIPLSHQRQPASSHMRSSESLGSRPQERHGIHPKTGMPERLMQMQLLPCFLGWIVGYTIFGFLLNFYDVAVSIAGERFGVTSSYGSEHTNAIRAMLTASESTMSHIQLWVVSTALLYSFAFGFAGYTATRLTRVSPFKQSLGIMLWHGLFVVATVIVSFIPVLSQPLHVPTLTLLLAENFPYGFLLCVGSTACIFIGSLIGSFFGLGYSKRVIREQQRNIRD